MTPLCYDVKLLTDSNFRKTGLTRVSTTEYIFKNRTISQVIYLRNINFRLIEPKLKYPLNVEKDFDVTET